MVNYLYRSDSVGLGSKDGTMEIKISKEIRRFLEIVREEYIFDPIVSEEHKSWFFLNSLRCLVGLCTFYRFFHEDIEDLTHLW